MKNTHNRAIKVRADALLLITTFFWGITFVIVKEAIEEVGVFLFLSQRFTLAFLLLLPVCLALRHPFTTKSLKQGIILGTSLFGGYALQTMALLYTTASNTAFLTGLNVVFVPLIGALIFRQLITLNMKLGVVLAAIGLYLLCTTKAWTLNNGDILAILCAICVALHVILTGSFARSSDVYWLATIQLGVIAVFSTLIAKFTSHEIFVWHPEILWPLVICVLFATIFAFLVQTSMQRFTSPTHTALIFCMEPIFAALYAYWAIDERLGFWRLIGATLILAGMVLSKIRLSRFSFRKVQINHLRSNTK